MSRRESGVFFLYSRGVFLFRDVLIMFPPIKGNILVVFVLLKNFALGGGVGIFWTRV